jgi:SpoVK/Ycf46/Vps4 family AAA+-type ATPase
VLATTNHPDKLDEALTERPSRFDRVFTFGNPREPERRAYLSKAFGPAFHERLVVGTDGFSVAQLKEVRVSACLESVEQGLPSPTLEAALRAIARLRGQKESLDAGWEEIRPIGFSRARTRNSRPRG